MMDIRFQTATTRADVELVAHARRCLQSRLQHRSSCVDHIEVKLGNAEGRRPNQDSYCIVRLKLHGTPAATVVHIGADVHSAIDRATNRVCRLAEEQLRLASGPQTTQAAALAA